MSHGLFFVSYDCSLLNQRRAYIDTMSHGLFFVSYDCSLLDQRLAYTSDCSLLNQRRAFSLSNQRRAYIDTMSHGLFVSYICFVSYVCSLCIQRRNYVSSPLNPRRAYTSDLDVIYKRSRYFMASLLISMVHD